MPTTDTFGTKTHSKFYCCILQTWEYSRQNTIISIQSVYGKVFKKHFVQAYMWKLYNKKLSLNVPINLYFKVYHECDHDGQSVGYLLGSLYQDDSQTDGHPHHTSQEGRRANQGVGGRWYHRKELHIPSPAMVDVIINEVHTLT